MTGGVSLRARAFAAVTLLLALPPGCATSYTPRSSPYVVSLGSAATSPPWTTRYTGDGRIHELNNLWATGATDLVAGNAAAEEKARRAISLRRTSTVLSAIALAMYGLGVASYAALPDTDVGRPVGLIGISLSVPFFIGSASSLSAAGRAMNDAVNIYNDGVDERLGRGLPHER